MLYKFKNGQTIDLNKNQQNLVDRYNLVPADDPETNADEELIALREQAKELGIRSAHSMKKETLLEKIKEALNSK